jgi:hypothetical protein
MVVESQGLADCWCVTACSVCVAQAAMLAVKVCSG